MLERKPAEQWTEGCAEAEAACVAGLLLIIMETITKTCVTMNQACSELFTYIITSVDPAIVTNLGCLLFTLPVIYDTM